MKIEIESQDIEAIALRVSELIKPLLQRIDKADDKGEILDVKGLSELLHVNPSWVYKKVSLKAIPYFKAGKFPRFRKRDIERWMESQARKPIPVLKMAKSRWVAT